MEIDSIKAILAVNPLPDSLRLLAYKKAQTLISRFTYPASMQYKQVDKTIISQLERDAIILQQNIGLSLLKNRRQWMAHNIKWLLDHSPKEATMILWAANEHVSKQGVSMSHYLHKRWKAIVFRRIQLCQGSILSLWTGKVLQSPCSLSWHL
jgi:hypothetical protein